MTLNELNAIYDSMQLEYGDKNLRSIFYGGCKKDPDICFVFMNPTGKNIASNPNWTGLRAPWIGTKNIWDLFLSVGLFDEQLYEQIKSMKPKDWSPEFAEKVYGYLESEKIFITNLGKCTQADAKLISNNIYLQYLRYFEIEMKIINPKIIVLFGNQVSTVFLGQTISVSKCRKEAFEKEIDGKIFKCFPVFYPVGNGRVNINKSIEDIRWIIDNNIKKQEE